MNKVEIVGRLTRDVETRTNDNGNVTSRFTVAVNRKFKNAEGNYDADFIGCVAFGKTAEFVSKYFAKGDAIGLTGRIQTGSYEKEGTRIYTTDVVAEDVEFVESKNGKKDNSANSIDLPFGLGSEDELPFA